jgi:hypothetical protein
LVTPCERMHCAYCSRSVKSWAAACAVGAPPLMYFWHACWAAWNVGESGSTLPALRLNSPFAFGSGKSFTPCERMHCAYCNADPESLLDGCADPELLVADGVVVVVVAALLVG